jgi:hypothetical protein
VFEKYRKELAADKENRKVEIIKSQDDAHHLSLTTYPLYNAFLHLENTATPKGEILKVNKTHESGVDP